MSLASFHVGDSDPELVHTTYHMGHMAADTKGRMVAITDYYFPLSISQESCDRLDDGRDLTYFVVPPPSHERHYWRTPNCGWIAEKMSWGNQPATVRRVAYFWNSLESEAHFKENASIINGPDEDHAESYASTIWELLLKESRAVGMLGWREYHLSLHEVRSGYMELFPGRYPHGWESDDESVKSDRAYDTDEWQELTVSQQ
jgi:hypothetical protein